MRRKRQKELGWLFRNPDSILLLCLPELTRFARKLEGLLLLVIKSWLYALFKKKKQDYITVKGTAWPRLCMPSVSIQHNTNMECWLRGTIWHPDGMQWAFFFFFLKKLLVFRRENFLKLLEMLVKFWEKQRSSKNVEALQNLLSLGQDKQKQNRLWKRSKCENVLNLLH